METFTMQKAITMDEFTTSILEPFDSYSILMADGNELYLVIEKPHKGVTEEFYNKVLDIEDTYCESLGERDEGVLNYRYPIGYTDAVYRPFTTDALLYMKVEDGVYDLTDADRHDFQFENIVDFLTDNPQYVFRVIDGKQMIVKENI